MRVLFLVVIFIFNSKFENPIIVISGSTKYNFWIQTTNTNEKKPLLLFLHGKSLSGTDINKVKRYGILRAIEKGRKIDAYVVAPQLPSGSWNPDYVDEVVNFVTKNYPIDTQRIYVCGMSLGGYGTMHYVGKFSKKIAAAVEICGGGNEKDACKLSNLPIRLYHGDKDFIVHMKESKKMYNAIKNCNPNADCSLTIIPGGNHSNVENLFHQNEIYEWMFSKKLQN